MTEPNRIERAREFVRKFNNDEFEYIKNPNEDQLDTLEHLAGAKDDFEKADEEKSNWKEPPTGLIQPEIVNLNRRTLNYNFENALTSLLAWMGMAKVGDLYTEGGLKKEIAEFEIIKTKIEQERDNYKTLNEKLADENLRFRNGIIKIFNDFQEAETKYGWLLENPKKEVTKID